MDVAKRIKPIYRSLAKLIHPDFFNNNPTQKLKNQETLQLVQNWLNPAFSKSPSTSTIKVYIPRTAITMYINDRNEKRHPATAVRKVEIQSLQEFHELCSKVGVLNTGDKNTTTETSSSYVAKSSYLGVLLFIKFIRHIKTQIDFDLHNIEELEKELEKNVNFNDQAGLFDPNIRNKLNSLLRAARQKEAYDNIGKKKARGEELYSLLRKSNLSAYRVNPNDQPSGPEFVYKKNARLTLDKSNIFFSKDVSPNKWSDIINELEVSLKELRYDLWKDIPVMIMNKGNGNIGSPIHSKFPGFIVLQAGFDIQEVNRYIDANLSRIRLQRMSVNSK